MAKLVVGQNDLASQCPEVAAEWDYEKNGDVTPEMVHYHDRNKFWWICSTHGVGWETSVVVRSKGCGCPQCRSEKISAKRSAPKQGNSIAERRPDVAAEWDREKNGELTPDKVSYGSKKRVWWVCPDCGLSYKSAVYSRSDGEGCPECRYVKSSRKNSTPKPGRSLAEVFPDIAAEWSDRNDVAPGDVYAKARRGAWWKCSVCGNEWEAAIYSRTCAGNGCPECAEKQRRITAHNTALKRGSLATENPESAKCFNLVLNAPLTPEDVTTSSTDTYYWTCSSCGETFTAKPVNMKGGRTTCAHCSTSIAHKGMEYKRGYTKAEEGKSLADVFPEIAAEWSEDNDVEPRYVTPSSGRIALWVCPHGHKYDMKVANRTQLNQGCPYCSGRRVIQGETDMATQHPELLDEWDYELNDVSPDTLSCGSHYRAHWKCGKCGHRWAAWVKTRTDGCGCPRCKAVNVGIANRKPKPGGKYLSDEFPEIALEWDYSKNGSRTPSNVASRSGKAFWWICPDCGHSYSMVVCDKTRLNQGCPECSKARRTSFPEKALFYYLSKCFPDAEENRRDAFDGIGRFEIDVWLPSIQTGVEYDGQAWHKDSERDIRKDEACSATGVRLIRVREPECPELSGLSEVVVRKDAMGEPELEDAIREVLSMLGVTTDIDIARDRCDIRRLMSVSTDYAGTQLTLDFGDAT